MRFFITTFILVLATILVGSVLVFDPNFEKINTFIANVKSKQDATTAQNTTMADASSANTASTTNAGNNRGTPTRPEKAMMSSSAQSDKVYDLCVTVLPSCVQTQERRRICNCAASQAKMKFTQTDWDYFQYISYHKGGFSIQAPVITDKDAKNAANLGEKINTAIEYCS